MNKSIDEGNKEIEWIIDGYYNYIYRRKMSVISYFQTYYLYI